MNRSPLSISWPWWLVFAFLLIGPPTAVAKLIPNITTNPFGAFGLLLTYEVLVCLGIAITAIIKKVWERRGDMWVDAGTGRAEKMVRLLFADANHRYQTFFRYEYADLDMKGISTRGTYSLDLEQVFVEVRIDPTTAHKVSADPIHLPVELQSGTHDIWDYLTLLDQHLVILGAPGSGKTTLLKHLGLSLVQNHHQRKVQTKNLPWTLPLYLPLREHSAQLKEHPAYSLVDAANVQIDKWKQSIPPEWIEGLLQKGRCLVLLDGLDEVANAVQRQQMVDWVQLQMLAYPKNRFVITSRPLGYRSNPLERVAVLEVQPFTFEQITQFLLAWYLANEIKRAVRDDPGVRMKAHEGAEDLLKRFHTTPALFAMAVNPLLLTMIATVHLFYGKLPGARITLYKAICEVFLSRRTEVPIGSQELRAEQRQLVLQSLAYNLLQQGQREISREDACQIIVVPLQLVSSTQTPQDFLDHLEAITSGLFLEREQGEYSFAHQTFQEYLAMIYIQENRLEQELLSHVDSSWWHETILLYCAQADATAILQACITQVLPSLEALTLAIDCVEEARTVKAEVKERLYLLLEQGINDAEPERRKVIAEALLKRRLLQMHPLQGVTFVDTSFVTCVEYQLFLDEQLTRGHNLAPDTWIDNTFPEVYGKDSLRGVRVEDAKAFCQWLTERDREGQSYRLPRREEYQQIQRILGAGLLGDVSYWEENGSVVWPLGNPSRLLREQVLKALIPRLKGDLARSRAGDPYDDFARAYDIAVNLTAEGILYSEVALARAIVRTRDLASGLGLYSLNARALTSSLGLVGFSAGSPAIGLADRLFINLAHARDLTIDPSSIPDLAHTLALALADVRDITYALAGKGDIALANDLVRDLPGYLSKVFEIYIYNFLVQRPKGMFPVYEGILLIKERKTETLSASRN